mmetsp:Transcript_3463/g.7224  ORF Transcript_3463/g.7224 Transcript_3463/m.7224 type:complete len:563 (-) Transcript_3463:124-1812(-)
MPSNAKNILATVAWLLTSVAGLPMMRSPALIFSGRSNNVERRRFRLRKYQQSERNHRCNERRKLCAPLNLNALSPSVAPANTPLANASPSPSAKHSLHLLSLPPMDDSFSLPGESLVRECWRWKDSALGDGRDYFVPRPRTLKAFHSLFVGMEITVLFDNDRSNDYVVDHPDRPSEVMLKFSSSKGGQPAAEVRLMNDASVAYGDTQQSSKESFSEKFVIEECAALSNCARLDVILVLATTQRMAEKINDAFMPNATEIAVIAARYAVAYHLQQQISSQRSKNSSLLEQTGLASWLDLPGAINFEKEATPNIPEKDQCAEIYQLAQRLASMEGARSISTHLSLIAGGLAPRPNRPDREVIFRPYSSRDAHILLQLKRTVEVVSALNPGDLVSVRREGEAKTGGRGRIKTLLDGALSAGKGARNEEVVSEIKRLREYGSDGTPPAALANIAAEAAIQRAVKPAVATCVARLAAMETDTAERISRLRRRVGDIVNSLEDERGSADTENKNRIRLKKMANRLLHEPTMQLREGRLSEGEIDDVVKRIEEQLIHRSCAVGHRSESI